MINVRGQRPNPFPACIDPPSEANRYASWYFSCYLRGMGGRQLIQRDALRWAWHAYSDGKVAYNRASADRWTRYLRLNAALAQLNPTARVWATEQGVVLHNGQPQLAGTSVAVRNAIMRAYVQDDDSLVAQPRVDRFYYYQYRGDRPVRCHDSGLVEAPALDLWGNPEANTGSCVPARPVPAIATSPRRDLYNLYRDATNAAP
jgi:hypothetical protein